MSKKFNVIIVLALVLVMIIPTTVSGSSPIHVTLLHTNDFHGRLEPDSSGRGGSANIAGEINRIRAEVGAENVALLDAGDV